MDESEGSQPHTTVRCQNVLSDGQACGSTLWRVLDPETIEVSYGLRAGKRSHWVMPVSSARQAFTDCVRCGTRWFVATACAAARLPVEEAVMIIHHDRPLAEVVPLLNHNADHDEAAA